MSKAHELKYKYTITIDADGQHNTSDVVKIFDLLKMVAILYVEIVMFYLGSQNNYLHFILGGNIKLMIRCGLKDTDYPPVVDLSDQNLLVLLELALRYPRLGQN